MTNVTHFPEHDEHGHSMYEIAREYKRRDPAWVQDDHRSNPMLKDGDVVTLKHDTCGEYSNGYAIVHKGSRGRIVRANTPRVCGPGQYFAKVDIHAPSGAVYRVRVPHSALEQ